jgi:hypothetical protein
VNKIVPILAILIFASAVFAAENEAGLVLHYGFDKSADSTLRDKSGSRNHGQIIGGTRWVKGEFGSALEFNGTDGYIDCGAKPSLNIGKAGTIAFWFKAKTAPQGGLVGWAPGEGNTNQRLVVSLNTYAEENLSGPRVWEALAWYISDGKNFDRPYKSSYHQPYFPPANKWLFYTLTFDGRNVETYRDGVHVETRLLTLIPDTKNVSMLIGKCFGMGGTSDYFKGLIDEVRIYNRPLSNQEVYKLYMRDAKGRAKHTDDFESINIKPIVMARAGRVFADLDYRGLVPTTKDLTIKADLLDAQGTVVAKGSIKILPVWGRAEVVFDTAKLPAGKYTVSATATKGKPATLSVDWPGRAKGWENIKVFNNFVWELLNESPGAKPDEKYTFNNPRRGWVYVLTVGEDTMTISLDGAKPDAVRARGKGGRQESMRWMPKGECTLAVKGAGGLKSLIVRSVPTLYFFHYPHVGPGSGHDHDYLVEHVLSPYNTLDTHNYDPPAQAYRLKWAYEMGLQVIEQQYPPFEWNKLLKDETARQVIWDFVAVDSAGMNNPEYVGVTLDEFAPGNDRIMWTKSYYDEWTEVIAKIMEDPKYKDRLVIPFISYAMFEYEKSSAFMRMFIEHDSFLANEYYIDERDTEEQAWLHINEILADLVDEWEQAAPGYVEHTIATLSCLEREGWNAAVNYNVFMEMQYEHLATRPEFFGLAGIGVYTSYHSLSEEYVRWISKLTRHYGLEGNTERLGTAPYNSVQIRNPEFLNGTEDWTLRSAEKNSMAVKSHKGYGAMQRRYPYRGWTETPFLWTKRSAQKPNVFSQELRNLEPGKLYIARVWIGDYTDLTGGKLKGKKCAVNIGVDGGEIWDDWYRTKAFKNKGEKSNFFTTGGCQVQQILFRATGTSGTLTISDWQSAAEPGGLVGQELIFNRIDVHPYLEP